jgi:hypothetical protein
MFPEFKESAIWRDRSFKYLSEHMEKDVLPDGTHIEVTPGYHLMVLQEFLKISLLSKANGYSIPGLMDKHEMMFDFILDITKPDGMYPALGDAVPESSKPVLGLGAMIYKRGDMRFAGVEKAQPEWVWLLGSGVVDDYKKLSATTPALQSVLLPDSRYAVMRTGWQKEDRYLLFDCAPSLGSHSHGDRLQVLAYAGRDLLIDPGQYSYAEPLMGYFRGTRPHNVLVVDGNDQEWINPAIKTWHVGKSLEYVSGKMDLKDLSHQRTVVFVKPDYWLLIDHLTAKEAHEYTRQFQFPIGSNAVVKGKAALTQFSEGMNLAIIPVEDTKLDLRANPVPTSQTTTKDAPQATLVNNGKTIALCSLLLPFLNPMTLPVVERLEIDNNKTGMLVIQINFPNGRVDKIAIAEEESDLKINSFSRKATVLYLRKSKNNEEILVE